MHPFPMISWVRAFRRTGHGSTAAARSVVAAGVCLVALGATGCESGAARENIRPRAASTDLAPPAGGERFAGPPAAARAAHLDASAAVRMDAPAVAPALLRVHVLAVEQADAMLVIGPPPGNRTLLIDAGEPVGERHNNHYTIAERIEQITGGRRLDYFLATHFHSDHVGSTNSGVSALLKTHGFQIETVIDAHDDNAQYAKSPRGTYDAYVNNMNAALASGAVRQRVRPQFGVGQIDLGAGVQVEILAAAGRVGADDGPGGTFALVEAANPGLYASAPASENDFSIALQVTAGNFEIFTAGDLTGAEYSGGPTPDFTPRSHPGGKRETYTNVEKRLAARWAALGRDSDVEVVRMNHHGSAYSSIPQLVDRLDPEFMIYSCGGRNRYRHPDPSIVKRYAGTAWQYVTSGISGVAWNPRSKFDPYGEAIGEVVIEVSPDGMWYWINNETHKAYADAEEDGLTITRNGSGADAEEHTLVWVEE
ncbi:MAG: ComEC/Rec2 family competence protein [Phycisphaerae bacterium]